MAQSLVRITMSASKQSSRVDFRQAITKVLETMKKVPSKVPSISSISKATGIDRHTVSRATAIITRAKDSLVNTSLDLDLDQFVERAAVRARYIKILTLFTLLASLSTYLMWNYVGWSVLVQLVGIVLVALFGESFVSAQGYYEYPKKDDNGPFFRNVPVWIPFLWIFSIQASFLVGLVFGLPAIQACILSGILAAVFDLVFLEPYFSSHRELWIWDSVEDGYFKFVPTKLDVFTAPPGNYFTWLIFPIVINFGTIIVSTIFP